MENQNKETDKQKDERIIKEIKDKARKLGIIIDNVKIREGKLIVDKSNIDCDVCFYAILNLEKEINSRI